MAVCLGAACWPVCSLGDVRVPLLPGSRGVICGDSPICKGVIPLHRLAVCLSACDIMTTGGHVCLHKKGPILTCVCIAGDMDMTLAVLLS